MKRLLVIPLLFLYLLAISGVMIHVHYCGNKLESWDFHAKSTKGCKSDCDHESLPKCCKDKIVTIKIAQDHSASFLSYNPAPTPFICPAVVYVGFNNNQLFYASDKCGLNYAANAPPGLWQDRALYKLHSRFVYYG